MKQVLIIALEAKLSVHGFIHTLQWTESIFSYYESRREFCTLILFFLKQDYIHPTDKKSVLKAKSNVELCSAMHIKLVDLVSDFCILIGVHKGVSLNSNAMVPVKPIVCIRYIGH